VDGNFHVPNGDNRQRRRRDMRAVGIATLVMAALVSAGAEAQAPFPSRPIRMLVTIPPGGAPDISARLLALSLHDTRGWSFVIQHRPGANGNTPMVEVPKPQPDGHPLILAADSTITINPHVYGKLGIDTLKDLLPVSSVATNQFTLAINPQVPAKTFQ